MIKNNTAVISIEYVTQFPNDPIEEVQYSQYSDKEIVNVVKSNGTFLEEEIYFGNDFTQV